MTKWNKIIGICTWLRRGYLKSESESLLIAVQNNAIKPIISKQTLITEVSQVKVNVDASVRWIEERIKNKQRKTYYNNQ